MSEGNGPAATPRTANHAAYLRRLGHDDAADALDALAAATGSPVEPKPDTGRDTPAPERRPTIADAEAARQAEGEAMMAALKRSIPDIYDR